MISGGTTTLALFREIAGLDIQVITNNTLLISAIDEKTAATVFELMLELNRSHRTSLVLVTHDRSLARRLERVLELREGRLHPLVRGEV